MLGPKLRRATLATRAAAIVHRWKWLENRWRTNVGGNATGVVRSRKMVPHPALVQSASIAALDLGTRSTVRKGKPLRIEWSWIVRASSTTSALRVACKNIG